MIQPSTISLLVLMLLSILGYATYLQITQEQPSNKEGFCGVVDAGFSCGNLIKQMRAAEKETSTITIAEGKSLFKANCASCHAKDMKSKLTGPALGGVEERWSKYPRKDLYNFIRNSQSMIKKEKHPKAIELWNEFQPTIMNDFPNLTDDQIESLLLYIEMD